MTTIVYKDGQIAADGFSTNADGSIATRVARKIEWKPDGLILGESCIFIASCGDASAPVDIKYQMKKDGGITLESTPLPMSDFSGITMLEGGDVYAFTVVNNGTVWAYKFWQVFHGYYAMGSGSTAALNYINIKPRCTAKQAVAYASKHDIYTGGVITSHDTAAA